MATASSAQGSVVSRRLVRRVCAVIAAPLMLVAVVGGQAAPAEAAPPAPNGTKAAYEVKFLKEMVAHHHMAVMMTQICMARGAELRPELVELCRQIDVAQQGEVSMMQWWLNQWYGITGYDPMAEMSPEMHQMMQDMVDMSPAEFERFFLEDMIVHHAGALQPARQCKGKAVHAELKQLCADIVSAQTGEIELMRRWLCDWFGDCSFHIDPHKRRAMHG